MKQRLYNKWAKRECFHYWVSVNETASHFLDGLYNDTRNKKKFIKKYFKQEALEKKYEQGVVLSDVMCIKH